MLRFGLEKVKQNRMESQFMKIKRVLQTTLERLTAMNALETTLDRKLVTQIQPESLLFYYGNIHSQRGQDGILAEIFRRLNYSSGYFVEFGAWDGIYLSNSRLLFEKGWNGCFIEANPKKYRKLTQFYSQYEKIKTVNAMVGAPEHGVAGLRLKTILSRSLINPDEITFVSIDVDGPDLEVFLEMGFKPPVVLLEGGFNFSPYYTIKIDNEIAWRNIQQPLSVIIDHGIEAGYTPVCFYQDTYLVRTDLINPTFNRITKDSVTLYKEAIAFMPNHYFHHLMQFREKSSVIRELEGKYFGVFKINPMEYEMFINK